MNQLRLPEVPGLLRTPVGRWLLTRAAVYRAWPMLRLLAVAWRRVVVRRTRIVAVVGSLGKSTTAHAVSTVLGSGREMAVLSNQFGFLAAKVLAIRPGQPWAVIEVGVSAPGQMRAYADLIRPDITIVTSVAGEHLSSFKDLEVTRAEKAAMVEATDPEGLVVLNYDDPNVRWMAGRARARVVTFGTGEDCDVRGSGVRVRWPHGTEMTLRAKGETLELRAGLIGRHMAYPVLAAVAAATAAGFDLDHVARRVERVQPVPGRMQPLRINGGAWLLRDDFKAAEESLWAAIETLAEIPAVRKTVVLGDIEEPRGPQGPLYAALGERVAEVADRAFFVGNCDDRWAVGAVRGGMPRDAVHKCGSRIAEVARELSSGLLRDEVVLIKGRSTQRLERLSLMLAGNQVQCDRKLCDAVSLSCATCPMLTRPHGTT